MLPVSLGISSIALLHILDQQLRSRAEQGRHAGYRLHVLFVDQSQIFKQNFSHTRLETLQQRFPNHTYSVIPLDESSNSLTSHVGAGRDEHESIQSVASALPSLSSKSDFIDIVRRRLILTFANENQCDTILFGDSTTRLAERTLSETAKGRGNSLPWLTSDGFSSGVHCVYPMRDLLRKEIVIYGELVAPPLSELVGKEVMPVPVSSKDTTIEGLMTQYFASVEDNYPSIVANVVRTSGKLTAPPSSQCGEPCNLCGHPILDVSWNGDQESAVHDYSQSSNGSSIRSSLCHGCTRTLSKS